MNRLIPGSRGIRLMMLACVIFACPAAYGQQSAEQYIPIGYSPGVSGKYSYIGPIVAVDRNAHTITVEDRGELRVIKVTEQTHIWLDRSKTRRENRDADYADCEVGRMIEVKYSSEDQKSADWIKIESR